MILQYFENVRFLLLPNPETRMRSAGVRRRRLCAGAAGSTPPGNERCATAYCFLNTEQIEFLAAQSDKLALHVLTPSATGVIRLVS